MSHFYLFGEGTLVMYHFCQVLLFAFHILPLTPRHGGLGFRVRVSSGKKSEYTVARVHFFHSGKTTKIGKPLCIQLEELMLVC